MKSQTAALCCQLVTCDQTFGTQADLDRHLFSAPGHHVCRYCRTVCQDAGALHGHVESNHAKLEVLSKDPYVIFVRLSGDQELRRKQFAEAIARLRSGLQGRRFQMIPDATHEPAPGIRETITYYAVADAEDDLPIIVADPIS